MGKDWDGTPIAFSESFWREAIRVVKPGGHILVFGSPKTFHWLAMALERAGAEPRDCIMWIHGQGFPKSLNISKAIDRMGGDSVHTQADALKARRVYRGMSREQLAEEIGCTAASIRDWEEGRARTEGGPLEWIVPSEEYRAKLALFLGYSEDEREIIGGSTDRRGDETVIGLGHSGVLREGGQTEASQAWAGWGTALKPAWEPILVFRKPLKEGTVAEQVLKTGTGALNIDGCRVAGVAEKPGGKIRAYRKSEPQGLQLKEREQNTEMVEPPEPHPAGRWPSHILLTHSESCQKLGTRDVKSAGAFGGPRNSSGGILNKTSEPRQNPHPGYASEDGTETVDAWDCEAGCPVKVLDEQSGNLHGAGFKQPPQEKWSSAESILYGDGMGSGPNGARFGDSGGASRFFQTFEHEPPFFYAAKASRSERDAGLKGEAVTMLRFRSDLTEEQRANVLLELERAGVKP